MVRSTVWTLATFALLFCSALSVSQSRAAIILTAEDAGFYNAVGRHSKLDGSPAFGAATPATFNYSVGTIDDGPPFGPPGLPPDVLRKNYFTYDLAGITPGTITGGTLKLFVPPGGYAGPASITYKLYGSMVPGPAGMAALSADLKSVYSPSIGSELASALSLFAKIGDTKAAAIPEFGSITLTSASEGTIIAIPLSPSGVTYLNLFAGGDVVLGGELAGLITPGPPDDPPIFLFGFSSPVIPGVVSWDMSSVSPTPTPVLEIDIVPEPGSMSLVFTSLVWMIRRKRS